MNRRGQLVWDQLIPWLIAIGVLILIVILYFILTEKANSAIDFFKNLIQFGK